MNAAKVKLKGRIAPPRDDADLTANDPRYARGQAIIRYTAEARSLVTELFAETPLAQDEARITQVLGVQAEIVEQWGKAQNSFLTIGRKLLDLKKIMSKDEFIVLRRSVNRLFPFSDSIASQLLGAAEFLIANAIPEREAPSSYSVAYQLSLLPGGAETARRHGLLRPNVRRTEILTVRRQLEAKPAELPAPGTVSFTRLEQQATRIRAEQEKLAKRQDELSRQLAEVERKIALLEKNNSGCAN